MNITVSNIHQTFPRSPNLADIMTLCDHFRTHALLEHTSRRLRLPDEFKSINEFEQWRMTTARSINNTIVDFSETMSEDVLVKCILTLIMMEVPGTKAFNELPHLCFDLHATGRILMARYAELMGAHWASGCYWDSYVSYLFAISVAKLNVTGLQPLQTNPKD